MLKSIFGTFDRVKKLLKPPQCNEKKIIKKIYYCTGGVGEGCDAGTRSIKIHIWEYFLFHFFFVVQCNLLSFSWPNISFGFHNAFTYFSIIRLQISYLYLIRTSEDIV